MYISCQRSHNDDVTTEKVISVGDAKCMAENHFAHSHLYIYTQTHTHTYKFRHVIPIAYRQNTHAGKTRAAMLLTARVRQY